MNRRSLFAVTLITFSVGPSIAVAQTVTPPTKSEPSDYCTAAIANLMVDRTRHEREALLALASTVDARRRELDAAIVELKKWMEQRHAFRAQARSHVVQLYARMSSEAASTQLAMIEPQMASAIVAGMDPRVASVILSEMEASQAARISALLATVADLKAPREARQ
jgi:flagellar motility protein MotE (MotC chaperone)